MTESIPQCALDLIKPYEGYARKLSDGSCEAYPDPEVGWKLPTVGWGSTVHIDGSPVRRGDTLTRAQADATLMHHIAARCLPQLQKIPTWDQMNDNQKGALISFAYNVGEYFYGTDGHESITDVCDSPDRWDDAKWVKAQFVKYCNPKGPVAVSKALKGRREAEAELFCIE